MIQCYGLHWHINRVNWGRQNNPGELLGYTAGAVGHLIDFRDQIGVYALYADYDLVYVGQTGRGNQRLLNRLRFHRHGVLAERWNRFSWFGILGVNENTHELQDLDELGNQALLLPDVLNTLEAIVIAVAEPRLNRQGGRWGRANQYFQAL
ncbi:MAG: GIY-YIG nuclease family protein [Fimbriimonadales bacterium]|nr:GIY-YIG nuclease family protein [Fimbriimonadales bacterium]